MKKIQFTLFFLFCITICIASISTNYSFNEKKTYPTDPLGLPISGFTNMIHGTDPVSPISFKNSKILTQLSDTLHFNALVSLDDIGGTNEFGLVGQPLTEPQIIYTNSLIDTFTHYYKMNYLMNRAKIGTPCLGQRCVYEVQSGTHLFSNTDPNPFNDGFAYQHCSGDYITDSSRTVLHLTAGSSSSGIIAENIYENLQQVDFDNFLGATFDTDPWHFKPMMRIKTSDFNDTHKQDDVVVSIEVYRYDNTLLISIPIKVKDFKIDSGNTTYNGEYTEKFNLSSSFLTVSGTDLRRGINNGDILGWNSNCHVDFKINWHGNVDVWFDKLTVDDDRADNLFNDGYNGDIEDEANALNHLPTSLNPNFSYYIDELTYSMLSCIEYVQNKYLHSGSLVPLKLSTANSQWMFAKGLKNNNVGIKHLMSLNHPDRLNLDIHELPLCYPENMHLVGTSAASTHDPLQDAITGKSAYDYNNELQDKMGYETAENPIGDWGSFLKQLKDTREAARNNPATANMYFSVQPQLQANMSYTRLKNGSHVWANTREPVNEEIQMQAMISLAHGADGLDWFWVPSLNEDFKDTTRQVVFGLDSISLDYTTNTFFKSRTSNMFGQNKFDYVSSMNAKLMKWKPWLDRIKWQAGYSVHAESGAFSRYISDLKSMITTYNSSNDLYQAGSSVDDVEAKYWEIGYFDPDPSNTLNANDHSKYFLLANRRCYPTNEHAADGIRIAQLKFNKDQLTGFNNWRLTDITSGNSITFNKNTSNGSFVDLGTSAGTLGYFNPGEGKLFRLQPVMETGGILDGDESVSGITFNCGNMVYNAGHKVSIEGNVSVSFDSAAGIKMAGGKLKIGYTSTGGLGASSDVVTLQDLNGKKWMGITCDSSSLAYFYQADFKALKDTCTFLTMNNTDTLTCTGCNFFCAGSGANHPNGITVSSTGTKITHNNLNSLAFGMAASSDHAVSVVSAGSNKAELFMNYVTINNAGTGSMAVFTNNCNAAIKNSSVKGFLNCLTALASDVHLFHNNFTIKGNGTAVSAASYANLYLGMPDRVEVAGYNVLDYNADDAPMENIHINIATFDMYRGNNVFYVSEDEGNNYHVRGVYNYSMLAEPDPEIHPFSASGNCFYYGLPSTHPGAIYPVYDILDNNANPMTLSYTPSASCDHEKGEDPAFITDLGNGIFDTIYFDEEGYGGGFSSKHENSLAELFSEQNESSAFALHSAIELFYRRNMTDSVYNACYSYLDNYFDSTSSPNAIARLYSSAIELDKKHPLTVSRASSLKTYYEGLILSHSENERLVKMLFYYIQKAKIALDDYEGAMDGLQQIINQNPYSYEGLVASWDYMSAYLQNQNSAGNGGGEGFNSSNKERMDSWNAFRNVRLGEIQDLSNETKAKYSVGAGFTPALLTGTTNEIEDCDENGLLFSDNPLTKTKPVVIHDDFDKKKFNLEQRTQITKAITTTLTKTKQNSDDEIKKLKSDADNGNKKAKKLLEEKKILKESVKVKRPSDNVQLVAMLNNDIKKVFHKENAGSDKDSKKTISALPVEYKLNQNYPNPFNPVTKISFSIPADSKVKLIVYDILGREVIRLINDELRQPGNYMMEFNGTQLASGIYFYRLVAEGTKNFTQVKKMVLVK